MFPVWTIRGGVVDPAPRPSPDGPPRSGVGACAGSAGQAYPAKSGGLCPEAGRGEDSPAPDRPADSPSCTGMTAPFFIWGIVNVTPDSFHDGGSHPTPASALIHAHRLAEQGADVLDIGGASSRPGAEDVSVTGELSRVLPVARALLAERDERRPGKTAGEGTGPAVASGTWGRPLVSVDTWRADVAEAVLQAGANIINDISACAWEPRLRDVVAEYKPGYVLMHCQGRPGHMQDAPRYAQVVDEVVAFFERNMAGLVGAGLPESNIVLDPGIGFGKSVEHNLALLAATERLLGLGRPLLLGVSHKSLFGDLLGLPKDARGEATQVCTALMAARGYRHHRVHDVEATRRTLSLVRAVSPL